LLTKDLYQLYLLRDWLELRGRDLKIASGFFAIVGMVLAVGSYSALNSKSVPEDTTNLMAMMLGALALSCEARGLRLFVAKIFIQEDLEVINKHINRLNGQL
jgi:hypothetical protein